MRILHFVIISFCLIMMMNTTKAQDLDPRAYSWIPAKITFLVTGFSYSYGGVITDPTLPIKDIHADIETPSLALGHSFGLFGKTAQVTAAVPYSWAQASGTVGGGEKSTSRAGLCDMRFRFSILLLGGPASTFADIVKAKKRTILGASCMIVAPTGQYYPEKLINLGTSRWSFKPELALSQPLGARWLIDLYTAVWFFTNNDSYYPGNSVRSQNPMGAFQTHISYNLTPTLWTAFDLTYYTGGSTTVGGVVNEDRQSNMRIGATLVLPVSKINSVKLSVSRGAIIRYGSDFTTVSIGWQTLFFKKPSATKPQAK